MLPKIMQVVGQTYTEVDKQADDVRDPLVMGQPNGQETQNDAQQLRSLPRGQQIIVWRCFFLLWLGGTWPYQAILQVFIATASCITLSRRCFGQAQAYYVKAFKAQYLEFYILMTFTWGLLVCHLFQVLSGSAKVWVALLRMNL
jgi:hypothetical protein